NDAANDSRVLKESASLRDEGYQVRIIAVERRELGRAAQTTELREGLCLQRVPEFTIERILPALAPLWRHLIRHEAVAEPAAGPPAPGPLRPGAPLASTRARVLRGLRNVGGRAHRTLARGPPRGTAPRAGPRRAPAPAAGPPAPGPLRPGAPLASTRARVLRGLRNVGERAYRTLALGTYWVNAARAGHDFAPDVVHANDANTLVPALAIRALSPT